MSARVAFLVAVADNRVIGRDNDLPWRIPTDLRHFRRHSIGKPNIMGRRTYESLGAPLKERDNIVLTRDPEFTAEGVEVAHSPAAALKLARDHARRRGTDEIVVIGGAEIFAAMMDEADRIYLTEVHAEPEGDTLFPELDRSAWVETSREGPVRGEDDSAPMSFVVLERRRS